MVHRNDWEPVKLDRTAHTMLNTCGLPEEGFVILNGTMSRYLAFRPIRVDTVRRKNEHRVTYSGGLIPGTYVERQL
jgi:hypothetical protein